MTYVFFIICALVLAILETVGLNPLFGSLVYDLQIPLIIAVSVLGRGRFAFLVIVIVAVIMDSLSGGPFGIYLTAYIWLFFPIKAVTLVVSIRSWLAVALCAVLGVLFENLIFMFVQLLSSGMVLNVKAVILPAIIKQSVLAFITAPFIFTLLLKGHTFFSRFEKNREEAKNVF